MVMMSTLRYPDVERKEHQDTYASKKQGSVVVSDYYRWLEGKGPEVDTFVQQQVDLTSTFIKAIPERNELEDLIRKSSNYPKFSAPTFCRDGRYYWNYNSGLQAQYVLFRSLDDQLPDFGQDKDIPAGEVFFDPNLLAKDGTAALSTSAFSKTGKYFAYGISLSGSDFFTIYVRETSVPFPSPQFSGETRPGGAGRMDDEIKYVKFSSIVWSPNDEGFFYQRYPTRVSHAEAVDAAGTEIEEDKFAKLYYHKLGTSQDDDILVMKDDEHPNYMWGAQVTSPDGRYLILYVSRDTARQNLLWVTDLEDPSNPIGPNMKWIKLIDDWEASYSVLANDGPRFYIKTNKDAPNYRVTTVDISNEERVKNRSFVPFIDEDPKAPIEQIKPINQDTWAIVYSRDVKDELYLFNKEGKQVKRLAADHIGVLSISGRRDFHRLFVTASGFTNPGVVYYYDFENKVEYPHEPGFVAVSHTDGMQTPMPRNDAEPVGALGEKLLETSLKDHKAQDGDWKLWQATKLNGLSLDEFKAEQIKYKSKDGTLVPMFIVSHKDAKRDGTAPAIQYGYGGFSISISPFFSAAMLTVLKSYGGVLAVPNIRGGAEYGETWHLAGTRENKVNVFDDFIAATQYLVDNKYAGPGKVIINGGSNGGLLVAACVNRAPEHTFGAAIAEVGVLDYLRFPQFTIGKAWTSDYGDPSNPEDFDFMYPISPYHNVDRGDKVLPPTLLLTADHDDRVVPLHSFKHIAELQYRKPTNPHPLLIRIDVKSGHGAGKSTEKRIVEAADKWSFAAHAMGLKFRHTA
ncbi:prolyl oligopeptidase [Rhizoctonia solani]|uniref:Prolyl endopeptidase n=1 Tax=Rhizoctonia solani TaxID=456999 RepID=A0A8H7HAZ5_9AGAM|nr:prolyl oligopeptidase [Rhizoctonia solani]